MKSPVSGMTNTAGANPVNIPAVTNQPPQAQETAATAAAPPSPPTQMDATTRLQLYRVLIGMDSIHSLSVPKNKTSFFSSFRRTPSNTPSQQSITPNAQNTGVYASILAQERKARLSYRWYKTVISTLYFTQILLSAIITALAAYTSSSSIKSPTAITITVLSAINTTVAGTLAYLKAQGLPTRKLLYKNQLARVREYAEWRERQFSIDASLNFVGAATLESVASYQADQTPAPTAESVARMASVTATATRAAKATSPSSPAGSAAGTSKPDTSAAPAGAILLDPQHEAEIVEQMYRAARQDEEANYPEFYSHGAGSGGQAKVPTVAQGAGGGGGIGGTAGGTTLSRILTGPSHVVANTIRSVGFTRPSDQPVEAQEMQERRPFAYGHGREYQEHHNDWQVQTPPQPLSAPPELGHDRTSGAYFGYDAARDSQDVGTQNVPSLETQHLLERIQPHLAQAEQHLTTASNEVHPYLRAQQMQGRQETLSQQGLPSSTSPPRGPPSTTRPGMGRSEATRAPTEQAVLRNDDTRTLHERAVLRPGPAGRSPPRTRGVLQRSNVVMHTHM